MFMMKPPALWAFPRELGGIPLDEMGATGYGVAQCADVAKDYIKS